MFPYIYFIPYMRRQHFFLFHGHLNIFINALHSTPWHRLAVWQICPDQQTKADKYVVRSGKFVTAWTGSPA